MKPQTPEEALEELEGLLSAYRMMLWNTTDQGQAAIDRDTDKYYYALARLTDALEERKVPQYQ